MKKRNKIKGGAEEVRYSDGSSFKKAEKQKMRPRNRINPNSFVNMLEDDQDA
ncbi:MAG: hypothetical protein ACRC37_06925 [Lentisphaeria bacterium]